MNAVLATANIRSVAIPALARAGVSASRVSAPASVSAAVSAFRPSPSSAFSSKQSSKRFQCASSMRDCRKHSFRSSRNASSTQQHQQSQDHQHMYQRGPFGSPGYPAQAPV